MVKTIKMNVEVESIDIPTMYDMPDADYREHVEKHGLITVDHHDVLRSSVADYPLATTLEQFDILIEVLKGFRNKMVSKAA